MKKLLNIKTLGIIFSLGLIIGICTLFYIGDKTNTGERSAYSLLKDKLTNTTKEPVNLIICWTPLQMVIAEKIIDLHPNEKFYTILMSHSKKNEKFEYYQSKLKQKSERSYSFYFPSQLDNKRFIYTTLLELKLKSKLLPNIKTIFLSNIDKIETHTIISSFPNAQIKTFDDGTLNLVKNSHLLNDEVYISSGETGKKFYKKFINSTISPKEIRENSLEHYTIFKDLPNIMERYAKKITYLPLFDTSKLKQSHQIQDTIKIMLGTAEDDLKETSEKVIKHFNIQYASLHPRQKYGLDNATNLKSELIIEDYLLQEIEKNPHTQYEIYTFFSGAALTLKDFPNVKVYAIKPTSFPKDYWLSPVYDLFRQTNIPIIDFNDK